MCLVIKTQSIAQESPIFAARFPMISHHLWLTTQAIKIIEKTKSTINEYVQSINYKQSQTITYQSPLLATNHTFTAKKKTDVR